MTKNKRIATLTTLVLSLGLVSCSKETEIQYKDDSFAPNDVLVEKMDRSFTALNNLTTMDSSLRFVINDENTPNQNKITNLVLSTTCRAQSEAQSYTHTSYWPNPTTIAVLDILPTDTLLQRKSEPTFCDINYTVTNANNSTSTGKTSNIKILDTNTFANLSADHLFSQPRLIWEQIRDVAIVPLENSNATIACDDFSHSLDHLSSDVTLAHFLSAQKMRDSQPKSSTQNCRAIFRTENAIVLSPVFKLDIPITSPVVTQTFSEIEEPYQLSSSYRTTFEITNTNPFPIDIKIDVSDRVLHARGVMGMHGYASLSPIVTVPLSWTVAGQPLTAQYSLNLPASSTVRLEGQIDRHLLCFSRQITTGSPKNYYLGFNLGLNADVAITYTANHLTEAASPIQRTGRSWVAAEQPNSHMSYWAISLAPQNFKSIQHLDLEHVLRSITWGGSHLTCALQ